MKKVLNRLPIGFSSLHINGEKHQFRVQVDALVRGVDKIEICGMLVTQWYMFQLHRNGQGLA